jgi:hypothetical protein
MTDQAVPLTPRPKRRRMRRILKVVFVLVALYAGYRYTLHRMVEAKLDEIRKQGYPVTLAELDKWYPQVPKEKNADTFFEQASLSYTMSEIDRLKKLDGHGFLILPPRAKPLSPEMVKAIDEHLTASKVTLDLYHKGAAVKQCWYPYQHIGYVNVAVVWSPHVGTWLFRLEAISGAERGDPEMATRAVIDSFSLADTIIQMPHAVLYLQGVSAVKFSIATFEFVVSRAALNDSQLMKVAAALHSVDKPQALTRALVGDRCSVIDDFSGESVSPRLEKVFGIRELFLFAFLRPLDRFVEVSQMPTIRQAGFALGRERLTGDHWYSPQWPKHKPTLIADLSVKGRLHAALTAIATERYRLANGKLPDKLDELVLAYLSAVPTDPFTGQPLRYKKLAKGYVVYSVGEDGKDDGGDEKKDITFTVER